MYFPYKPAALLALSGLLYGCSVNIQSKFQWIAKRLPESGQYLEIDIPSGFRLQGQILARRVELQNTVSLEVILRPNGSRKGLWVYDHGANGLQDDMDGVQTLYGHLDLRLAPNLVSYDANKHLPMQFEYSRILRVVELHLAGFSGELQGRKSGK